MIVDWTIPPFEMKECPICKHLYAVTETSSECFNCLSRQMGIVIIDHLSLKNKGHGSEEQSTL